MARSPVIGDQTHTKDQEAYLPAIAHARYHRLQRYAALQQQRSKEWQRIVNQATATYIFCQQSNHNWKTVKFPTECVPYDCTCPPNVIHHQSVDLIGLPEQFAQKINYLSRDLTTLPIKSGPIDVPNENEQNENPQEPDLILAMDGNYQQRHYAHPSKDCPFNNQYPPIFLQPSEISSRTTLCKETEVHVAGIDDPCAQSHKVANNTRDATTWEKCDDSGFFRSVFRHDVPLLYANIYKTGEKLYYPVLLLRRILTDFPNSKIGILYDIGCQLETHIKKQPNLLFGTLVFHAYVHKWLCQVKYNPQLNKWWGLSNGEGLERLWSFLSPLIPSLWVSTWLHRLHVIHVLSQYLAKELNESAGEWLHRKLFMALSTIKKSHKGLEKLHQLLVLTNLACGNYKNEFFQAQWDNKQAYHLETNVSFREKQEKELGWLPRMEDQLEAEWSANTFNVAEAIHCAQLVSKLLQDIEAKQTMVGDPLIPETQRDQLLKIWRTKTEMQQRFLALVEEKAPLVQVCCPGEQSLLGTNWQQKILSAIQKRAKQLHKILNGYNSGIQSRPAHATCKARQAVVQLKC
ncbi:hypothetical protein PTTG_28768 [Puccinia triticina 1-1 BBBD Race 1]|uniref:CxC1-like cysteine cluster associated with KDZ transposases domain-containing protein n=1 Tax=Puccinia triticina (isolate 1-1 / race 1 (BBBD)) TaxID=630390 RepID=A0A180G9N7_PUCT1|nr:hypothetical protein PTTG_28768 [Puccinia triticina 1-1 BBBD Race 1]